MPLQQNLFNTVACGICADSFAEKIINDNPNRDLISQERSVQETLEEYNFDKLILYEAGV